VEYIVVTLLAIVTTALIVYTLANKVFGIYLRLKSLVLCAACALFISIILPRIVTSFAGLAETVVLLIVFAIVFAYFVAYFDNIAENSAAGPPQIAAPPEPLAAAAGRQPQITQEMPETVTYETAATLAIQPEAPPPAPLFPIAEEAALVSRNVASSLADTADPVPNLMFNAVDSTDPYNESEYIEEDAAPYSESEEEATVQENSFTPSTIYETVAESDESEQADDTNSETLQLALDVLPFADIAESKTEVTAETLNNEVDLNDEVEAEVEAADSQEEQSAPADAAEQEPLATVDVDVESIEDEPIIEAESEAAEQEMPAAAEAETESIAEEALTVVQAETETAEQEPTTSVEVDAGRREEDPSVEIGTEAAEAETVFAEAAAAVQITTAETEAESAETEDYSLSGQDNPDTEDAWPEYGKDTVIFTMAENEKPASDSLEDLLDFAFTQKNNQQYPLALEGFRRALKLYRNSSAAPFLAIEIAALLKNKGSYEEAINLLSESRNLPGITNDSTLDQEVITTIAYLRIVKNILLEHRMGLIPFSKIPPAIVQAIEAEFRDWRNLA
jgi:hypothetical protein